MTGQLVLILGENGSGKSLYAEALMRRAPQKRRLYIATMQPYGDEGRRRVEKHRAQRAGDGYETLELPRGLDGIAPCADAAVLLEDVSNLAANILFDDAAPGTADTVLGEIDALCARCGALVAVSVRMPAAGGFTGETANYILAVERANAKLFEKADTVVQLRSGAPVILKGVLPW